MQPIYTSSTRDVVNRGPLGRLLITTQAVDLDDPVLGFFHNWIVEFAKHCESVEVICLKEGRHNLPGNVRVHSLGKETGRSRIKYLLNFYRYIFSARSKYDAVFVHMNQEYVLLGGLWWRLWGKKVVLWRNHKMGSWQTKVAAHLAQVVCYTSPAAYVAHFKNAVKMPIGIDTDIFKPPNTLPQTDSILFLGRLDPVKKCAEFMTVLETLVEPGAPFHADIYGEPTIVGDLYAEAFLTRAKLLQNTGFVTPYGAIANEKTPAVYAAHAIYVNLTPSGSFDKTIGEAMASGCILVVANEVLRGVIPDEFIVDPNDTNKVASTIKMILSMSDEARDSISKVTREYIVKSHSLILLTSRVMDVLNV